jgi:hypothetical protein
MSSKRDISPIGTSRFERPYSPPSARTSTVASPTTPTDRGAPFHFSKPSVASTAKTYSTAPTSFENIEYDLKGLSSPICALPEDREEWFDKYSNGPDSLFHETDECPDGATLAAVRHVPLYDAEGNSLTFGSLYDPEKAAHQRQLILFIRYFYCPACTLYVKALTDGITMHDYFRIPTPTSIIIIGCGQPDLIPHFKNFTGCPFTIYADPSRQLFKKLGMRVSLSIGRERPGYMGDLGLLSSSREEIRRITKSLKDPNGLRKRDLLRGGNPMQIGGEFLFENGDVLWCHRMTTYRNHAEVGYLRRLLQLDE